ncbi:MAG: hypothetical protein F9K19_17870 [Rhizobiaceae bacterium]|nr:MAG: hypothetical protein F9K19_17870 [Rhizobiaceae bacterium]CAG0989648.1 hypothetical protein RHIZO_02181 [Rhizobiaceae bacterium]
MKVMAATRLIAAVSALLVAHALPGSAAEQAWGANFACQVTSPERGDAPRITLQTGRRTDAEGKWTEYARLRLFNIPKLSEDASSVFAGGAVEIPGYVKWSNLEFAGRQEDTEFALYIPLPDIAQALGPLEGGHVLRITVQAKDGPVTFEVDLTGSSKAIATFRVCAT